MIATQLKPQHQDSVIGRALNAASAANYLKTEILPRYDEMEAWELNEYRNSYYDHLEELKGLKEYLIENKAHFNSLLSTYNMCVSIFITKYINPILF